MENSEIWALCEYRSLAPLCRLLCGLSLFQVACNVSVNPHTSSPYGAIRSIIVARCFRSFGEAGSSNLGGDWKNPDLHLQHSWCHLGLEVSDLLARRLLPQRRWDQLNEAGAGRPTAKDTQFRRKWCQGWLLRDSCLKIWLQLWRSPERRTSNLMNCGLWLQRRRKKETSAAAGGRKETKFLEDLELWCRPIAQIFNVDATQHPKIWSWCGWIESPQSSSVRYGDLTVVQVLALFVLLGLVPVHCTRKDCCPYDWLLSRVLGNWGCTTVVT